MLCLDHIQLKGGKERKQSLKEGAHCVVGYANSCYVLGPRNYQIPYEGTIGVFCIETVVIRVRNDLLNKGAKGKQILVLQVDQRERENRRDKVLNQKMLYLDENRDLYLEIQTEVESAPAPTRITLTLITRIRYLY